ncbi:unnamed protein product, partial [Brenthis ino]
MDVVGSEIGQKMRSAIKAKLTELGCYVDDELPDYVMVMVANKRTRAQMEDDLQLFLGDNTELFVNWLHQVLKKLQEVTVSSVPLKTDIEKSKEGSQSKERKQKDKKDKEKTKKGESSKKAKKKEKERARKKEEKKSHKSKKKSKHHEIIRPNIPPLLMNMEKESEPSITDVFAGQILKNHGVLLEPYKEEPKQVETKVLKRPIVPIIDPETITAPEVTLSEKGQVTENSKIDPRNEQIKEITQIEAKIQGLRQKLAEQLESMSDDEDFLNIRTEAEELMNDFAEDVSQEVIRPSRPPATPPLHTLKTTIPPIPEVQKPPKEIETLPQIELNLPKRPIRERLGVKEVPKVPDLREKEKTKETAKESPERFTPEKDTELKPRSARSRLGSQSEPQRKSSIFEDSTEKLESSKRLTSKVSVLESRSGRLTCASVVRVRPRPRVAAPASSLLLRAVADAHKSLLNIPPKVDTEPPKIKRALVLPMRRVDAHKIVIQVPVDTHAHSDSAGDTLSLDSEGEDKTSKMTRDMIEKEEFRPTTITKVINNTEYIPNKSSEQDDTIVDSSTIHNATLHNKDKGTQFIVTMDGYHPNAFLAKKLKTEGLLDDDEIKEKPKETSKPKEKEKVKEKTQDKDSQKESVIIKDTEKSENEKEISTKKRLSNTSEESDTQVLLKQEDEKQIDKRKSTETIEKKDEDSPPVKKRRASPIIFDVDKKVKEKEKEKEKEREKVTEKEKDSVRERTISASSDSVTLTTSLNSHKYDSLPPLSQAERKLVWCRAFPLCRYGAACAFSHPRCKFAAACTRRGCPYSHAPGAPAAPTAPLTVLAATEPPLALASHVVPAANYKSISAIVPSMCKFYPNCVNPACHFYHPKPCRFGKACANKLECNFYHHDFPKWKYSV